MGAGGSVDGAHEPAPATGVNPPPPCAAAAAELGVAWEDAADLLMSMYTTRGGRERHAVALCSHTHTQVRRFHHSVPRTTVCSI